MHTPPPPNRFQLRDLPLASRLAIAAFLVSVGIGYFAALVQLHFQHASPGQVLPTGDDAASLYHGRAGSSHLEHLLVAEESRPFNGSGSMRHAFTTRSAGWKSTIKRRAGQKNLRLVAAEQQVRAERDGERLALIDWIRAGSSRKSYDDNAHVLRGDLARHAITPEFCDVSADGTVRVKVASIMEARCARCHAEGAGGSAAQIPLENWEQVNDYCQVETTGGGMSLKKLAQTSHIHLLGFSLLYGLTGLIVTLTSYPGWLRAVLGLLPLTAQLVDIGFWWLARLDPMFAHAIVVTGGLVATGLALQIGLSLFNLFGKFGKVVLVALMLAAALGAFAGKTYLLEPYLERERAGAVAVD